MTTRQGGTVPGGAQANTVVGTTVLGAVIGSAVGRGPGAAIGAGAGVAAGAVAVMETRNRPTVYLPGDRAHLPHRRSGSGFHRACAPGFPLRGTGDYSRPMQAQLTRVRPSGGRSGRFGGPALPGFCVSVCLSVSLLFVSPAIGAPTMAPAWAWDRDRTRRIRPLALGRILRKRTIVGRPSSCACPGHPSTGIPRTECQSGSPGCQAGARTWIARSLRARSAYRPSSDAASASAAASGPAARASASTRSAFAASVRGTCT